jgi:transcriptional regulator with XRE-family HTH domain
MDDDFLHGRTSLGFAYMLQEKPLDPARQGATSGSPRGHQGPLIVVRKYRGPRDAKIKLDRERLRAERLNRGLTIEDVVVEGQDRFSDSTYKRAEKGREISILKAEEIAAALKADLKDLVAKAIAQEEAADVADVLTGTAVPAVKEESVPEQPPAPQIEEPETEEGTQESSQASPPGDDDRIAARLAFLKEAAWMFVRRLSATQNVKLTVNAAALQEAAIYYFHAADRRKQTLPQHHRLDPVAVGALTCHALVRFRPIAAVEADGFLSEEQRDLFSYVNEMMALSVGVSIAGIDISHSMLVLIEMLKSGIDEINFYRAFRLLKDKK